MSLSETWEGSAVSESQNNISLFLVLLCRGAAFQGKCSQEETSLVLTEGMLHESKVAHF